MVMIEIYGPFGPFFTLLYAYELFNCADKEGDKDTSESLWGSKCGETAWHCQRPALENS